MLLLEIELAFVLSELQRFLITDCCY